MFHLLTGSVALAGNVDQVQDSGGVAGALIAFPLRRLIGFWGSPSSCLFAVIGYRDAGLDADQRFGTSATPSLLRCAVSARG